MKLDTEFKFQFFFLLLATLFASAPLALVPFLGSFIYRFGTAKGLRAGTIGILIQLVGFFVFFAFWMLNLAYFATFALIGPVVIFITAFRYTLKRKEILSAVD